MVKKTKRQNAPSLAQLLQVMARLRAPNGCPWDQVQTHRSLRYHAVEEVYELLDAIEAGDDEDLRDELGDLLMQVVFHCQLARERNAFDFDQVCRHLVKKLIRRHPHVFGHSKVTSVAGVWTQWDQIKQAEKEGTRRERSSRLDGIPRRLPALLRAEKLVKKARKAGLADQAIGRLARPPRSAAALGRQLFALAELAQRKGWSAEDLLRAELQRQERALRRKENTRPSLPKTKPARRARVL